MSADNAPIRTQSGSGLSTPLAGKGTKTSAQKFTVSVPSSAAKGGSVPLQKLQSSEVPQPKMSKGGGSPQNFTV